MDREITIGLVGARFAGAFHAKCWQFLPEAKLVAVAAPDDNRRSEFQSTHSVSKGYRDYQELVEDPAVQIVDICAPNFLHAEIAIAALRAGKHVICEKPLATTVADGRRILDAQKASGGMFFYAEDWMFAPALVRLGELLSEAAVGTPLFLKGKETHNGSHSAYAQTIRHCGGGSLIHMAVHPIGWMLALMGMPRSVIGSCSGGGQANMVHKTLEGEDWALGILNFDSGARGMVEANYITCGGMDDEIEVYGTDGVIKVQLTLASPLSVYSRRGFSYAVEKADDTRGWTRPAIDEYSSLGYRDEFAHFLGCVAGREKQRRGTFIEDGLDVLEVVAALYKSQLEGRRVEL